MNNIREQRINTVLLVELLRRNEFEKKKIHAIKSRLSDITELAFKNKVPLLFHEKLQQLELDKYLPEHYRIRIRRLKEKLKLYIEVMDELVQLASEDSIDLVFVKTIRPFKYVGDDIDILTSKRDYNKLIKLVKERLNFKVEGWGPSETTLYKYVNKIKLMVDVHYKLAASFMSYVDTNNVLTTKKTACISYACTMTKLPIPIPEYSILITSAHALLKELKVNLADLLEVSFRLRNCNTELLQKLVTYEGLKNTLHIITKYLHELNYAYDITPLPRNIRLIDLMKCYTEKVANKFRKGEISEIIRLPLTNVKGYKILAKYMRRA